MSGSNSKDKSQSSPSDKSQSPSPRRDHRPSVRRMASRTPSGYSPARRLLPSSPAIDKENSPVNDGIDGMKRRSLTHGLSRRNNSKKTLQFESNTAEAFIPQQADSAVKHPKEDRARRDRAGLTPYRNPLRNIINDSPAPGASTPQTLLDSANNSMERTPMTLVDESISTSAPKLHIELFPVPAILAARSYDHTRTPESIIDEIELLLSKETNKRILSRAPSPVPRPVSQPAAAKLWSSPYVDSRDTDALTPVPPEQEPAQRPLPSSRSQVATQGVSFARPFAPTADTTPVFTPALVPTTAPAAAPLQRSVAQVAPTAVNVSIQCSSPSFINATQRSISSASSDESMTPPRFAFDECSYADSVGLEDLLGFDATPFRAPVSEQRPQHSTSGIETDAAIYDCDDDEAMSDISPITARKLSVRVPTSPLPEEHSLITEAMTALTIDVNRAADVSLPPQVLIASRVRHREDFDDVKELLFQTFSSSPTTILLSFRNQRGADMVLRGSAVQMRFDSATAVEDDANSEEAFSLRPAMLTIAPSSEGIVYVTFAPSQSGIYSGVLKLKCNKRFFTFLLRGENRAVVPTLSLPQPPLRAPVSIFEEHEDEADYSDMASITRERTRHVCDWIARSKSRVEPTAIEDTSRSQALAPLTITPSRLELARTYSPTIYKASFRLSNNLPIVLRVQLRTPFSCLQLETAALEISPNGTEVVEVCFDRKLSTEVWDQVYVVVMLANGFERHVMIGTAQVEFAVEVEGSRMTMLESVTPKIRHRRLERSVSMVSGLYFKRTVADFGMVMVGSLSRCKVELCNATDSMITVHIADPPLPFVLLHNHVHIRPRSYVRIPIRFVPVTCQEFASEVVVQSENGTHVIKLQLRGRASIFVE